MKMSPSKVKLMNFVYFRIQNLYSEIIETQSTNVIFGKQNLYII